MQVCGALEGLHVRNVQVQDVTADIYTADKLWLRQEDVLRLYAGSPLQYVFGWQLLLLRCAPFNSVLYPARLTSIAVAKIHAGPETMTEQEAFELLHAFAR